MIFLQRNASFHRQEEEPEYQYVYRITGRGPEVLETKSKKQWYTGWLNRITGEGPVNILLSEQSNGIPVSPTGLLVDCQVPQFNRPFILQMLYFLSQIVASLSKQ